MEFSAIVRTNVGAQALYLSGACDIGLSRDQPHASGLDVQSASKGRRRRLGLDSIVSRAAPAGRESVTCLVATIPCQGCPTEEPGSTPTSMAPPTKW